MLRALAWKEWRQQRSIVVAGVGLAFIFPVIAYLVGQTTSNRVYAADLAQLVPFLTAALVWPLFAAVIAGTASCGDVDGGGSLVFLLSRPVSRATIWTVKLAVAVASLATVVAASFMVAELFYFRTLGSWYAFPFVAPLSGVSGEATWALVLGSVLVCFAATVFAGLFTRQSLTAAAAGVSAALVVGGAGLMLQSMYSSSSRSSDGSEAFLWGFFSTIAVATLVGSSRIFTHGGLLAGAELRRTARVVAPAILVVWVLGTMLSASVSARVDISTSRLGDTLVSPGARQVVIGVRRNDFTGKSYFVAGPDDEPRRVTARMASGGAISPDGRWLVYSSRLGPLGVRRVDCHLRAVRLDGTDDHLVADPAPCTGQRLFAHDGSRLAVGISPDSTMIVDLSGQQEPRMLAYEGTRGRPGSLVRWTADDTKLVVIEATSLSVLRIDVSTGESERIYVDEAANRIGVRAATDTHMVVYSESYKRDESGRRTWSYRQVLVDLRTGETSPFLDDCARNIRLTLSADGSAIIHVGCTEPFDEPDPEVWIRDLQSGAERLLARLEAGVLSIRAGGRRGRILVVAAGGRRYFVGEEDGTVQPIDFAVSGRLEPERGWSLLGWIGDSGALLLDRGGRNRGSRLAYYDLDAGEGRIIVESECGLC